MVYPEPNVWNEHPYYILDVPWSDDRQRQDAARIPEVPDERAGPAPALEQGFRPGNPAVPVDSPESPLVRTKSTGSRSTFLSSANLHRPK